MIFLAQNGNDFPGCFLFVWAGHASGSAPDERRRRLRRRESGHHTIALVNVNRMSHSLFYSGFISGGFYILPTCLANFNEEAFTHNRNKVHWTEFAFADGKIDNEQSAVGFTITCKHRVMLSHEMERTAFKRCLFVSSFYQHLVNLEPKFSVDFYAHLDFRRQIAWL